MPGRSVVVSLLLACSFACGGRAEEHEDGAVAGASGSGARAGAGAGGRGAGGVSGAPARGGSGAGGEYVDPGCPQLEPPPPLVECHPFEAESRCPAGDACFPYVEHPFGRGCGVATYGAICIREGNGVQGDVCGQGTSGCAARHLCVVGAHSGRRCARLCVLDGPNECPPGMICGETDVQGYGVCN
jgi:hypothetical protein